MGKLNEIQEQTTQSWGSNSFTTTVKENTVEFDSAKDKFTFLDPVEVPGINIGGTSSVPFTSEDRAKLDNLQTPMQIKGRVDSVGDLPTEDVSVGDTYLVGLSGSETFDEYVCVELSGSPEAPVWESVGKTQAQADWNQNNNTASDYVKNRTHYVETTNSTLFNDTFLYTEHQMNISAGMVELSNPFEFEEGKQYTVTKDGVEYVLTAQIVDDTPSLIYGNFTDLENGSWMMAVVEGDNFYVSECAETELSSTVLKIEVNSETVHQLDDKFIPNTIARTSDIPAQVQSDWNQNDNTASDYVKNRPIYETGNVDLLNSSAAIDSQGLMIKYFNPTVPISPSQIFTVVLGDNSESINLIVTNASTELEGSASGTAAQGGSLTLTWDLNGVYGSPSGETASLFFGGNPTAYGGVSVSLYSKNIKKIDQKYIPFNIKDGGNSSIIEGDVSNNTASGEFSHAEGNYTTASGKCSHTEGSQNTASGLYSHAEGSSNTASGMGGHTEGNYTTASGDFSHTEGNYTTASGKYSHAEGSNTTSNHRSQHTFGEWNILDQSSAAATEKGNYIEIVGNGTNNNARSNARTLDWKGNEWLKGSISTSEYVIDGIDDCSIKCASEIIDASSDVAFTRILRNSSSTATYGYAEILYKITSGVTASVYINSADSPLTADGSWHTFTADANPGHGVEFHINNPSPVTDAVAIVVSKVYYI